MKGYKLLNFKIISLFAIVLLWIAGCSKSTGDVNNPPASPPAVLPTAPTNLTFSSIHSEGFTISWQAAVDIESFNVYIYLDAGFTQPVTGYNPKSQTAKSAIVYGLLPVKMYYVKIESVKGILKSTGLTGNVLTGSESVYVVGWDRSAGNAVAKYWINGTENVLPNPTNPVGVTANAVFISNGDIHIAGSENFVGSINGAKYWKNGVGVLLSNHPHGSNAGSIYVTGNNDVYVAGYVGGTGTQNVCYWKNGTIVELTNTGASYGTSITVLGNDVYVAGYQGNGTVMVARYWKNGVAVNLSNGTQNAYATSIVVLGNDVYVAGYESNGTNTIAKYWKNGVAVLLSNPANNALATSLFVSGNDVYVSGDETAPGLQSIAKYWKNGTPVILSDGTFGNITSSIYVSGSDVYVSGTEFRTNKIAKYWKNTTTINLTNGSVIAFANGIFVK